MPETPGEDRPVGPRAGGTQSQRAGLPRTHARTTRRSVCRKWGGSGEGGKPAAVTARRCGGGSGADAQCGATARGNECKGQLGQVPQKEPVCREAGHAGRGRPAQLGSNERGKTQRSNRGVPGSTPTAAAQAHAQLSIAIYTHAALTLSLSDPAWPLEGQPRAALPPPDARGRPGSGNPSRSCQQARLGNSGLPPLRSP